MSGEGQIVEADGGGQKQAASAATHSPVVARFRWSMHVLRQRGQLPTLAAKVRWLYWRHARCYDYEVCHRCGRPVGPFTGSWWHADDLLWARAGGAHYGVLCPPCFTAEAEVSGIPVRWLAAIDGDPVPLATASAVAAKIFCSPSGGTNQ